jgi:hypothetical protein
MQTRLHAYSPRTWVVRAGTLFGLGYGELAVADSYKGSLLLEALEKQAKMSDNPEKDNLPFLVWNALGEEILSEIEGGKESAARWYGAFILRICRGNGRCSRTRSSAFRPGNNCPSFPLG